MNILITGGSGMIGSNIKTQKTTHTFLSPTSKELNLLDFNSVETYFKNNKIDFIIHLSANVGGLYKNMNDKVGMFRDNIMMNENILYYCHKYNVQNGLFCCSTCIFPNEPIKYPMDEKDMMLGEPHESNNSYAYAKRFLYFQCQNYNKQYGRKYICMTPCNLYGINDNFNLKDAHVIPSLIHKFYLSNLNNNILKITTGFESVRQFLYVNDFVKIILMFMENFNNITFDNIILSNDEIKIIDIVDKISKNFENVNYEIINKEEGQVKKTCSNDLFKSLYPNFQFTNFDDGLNETILWFVKNYSDVRK